MNQQPGYNPYQPQQPSAQPTSPAPNYGAPGGAPPAAGGYNPYAPPVAGSEQPMYGMDMEMQVLASRGTRLGAKIVDGLLSLAAALPGIIIGAIAMGAMGEDEGIMVMLGIGGLGALALGIYQIYLISTTGQTLAKKWMGIRIVKLDGELPGFVHGWLLRNFVMGLISNIPFVGPIVSLVNPLMIFGDERRCLHDHIAGTKVIVA